MINRIALAVMLLFPLPAFSQGMPCAPRERMLEIIIDRLGEVRQATGTAGRGATMEMFSGPTGDWSIVLHLPDGRSCLMANGSNFEPAGGLLTPRGNPT
jgi:hypothetical protein